MKIVINALPPNINKYIGRTNIWEYQKEKKKYHKLVKLSTIGINEKIKKCDMTVIYHFPDHRKRDTHNLTKCLLDGLVDANVIEDDNYTVLNRYTEIGVYDKNKSYVEILIIPIKQQN